MAISSSLQSQFTDSKTVNLASVIVTVDFEGTALLTKMANILLTEMVRMSPYAGYAPVAELTSEDLEKYLKTLTYLRVCAVSNSTDKSFAGYRALTRFLQVPVLMYQLLIAIGRAVDRDFNIEFRPAYTITQDELLSPTEMESVSAILRQFTNSGLKCVQGMPNDPEGDLDFMAMCHVEDEVVSYRKAHPCYGFLAAFFKQKELNQITGLMCRVLYGYESDYQMQLDAIMAAIDG